jgi:hypothetical protein
MEHHRTSHNIFSNTITSYLFMASNLWHRKAMDKGIVKAMAIKLSDIFAISVLKKHRKFCRLGFTHLDATPTFQKSFRSFWVTL